MSKLVRGNIHSDQIKGDHRLGDEPMIQMADGTYPVGNLPMYASDGSLTDSGSASAGGGGGGGFPYPIDEPPGSPDAMDDEFNGGSLDAKWTVWNQQTGQTITFNDDRIIFTTPYTVQKRAFGIYQPISGSGWKFRTKAAIEALTWNYFGVYIFVRRTTGGDKTLAANILSHSTNNGLSGWLLRLSGSDPSLSSEVDLYNLQSAENYLEVEYDGSGDVTFRYSRTGCVFSRMYKEAATSFLGGAPEYVGIGLHPWSDFTSDPNWGGAASFDWFRRIS